MLNQEERKDSPFAPPAGACLGASLEDGAPGEGTFKEGAFPRTDSLRGYLSSSMPSNLR